MVVRAYIVVDFNYFSCTMTGTMMTNDYCFRWSAWIRILLLLWLSVYVVRIWMTDVRFMSNIIITRVICEGKRYYSHYTAAYVKCFLYDSYACFQLNSQLHLCLYIVLIYYIPKIRCRRFSYMRFQYSSRAWNVLQLPRVYDS